MLRQNYDNENYSEDVTGKQHRNILPYKNSHIMLAQFKRHIIQYYRRIFLVNQQNVRKSFKTSMWFGNNVQKPKLSHHSPSAQKENLIVICQLAGTYINYINSFIFVLFKNFYKREVVHLNNLNYTGCLPKLYFETFFFNSGKLMEIFK